MKLFDWSLKIQGFDIAFAKAELARLQAVAPALKTKAIQDQKRDILTYHKRHNPFYKNFAGTDLSTPWLKVPIMTKKELQQPLAERLSDGYSPKSVYVGKTSGSSGHPFIFAKDKTSHALSWAAFQDCYSWFNIDLNNSKQARFYGIPLDTLGFYKERIKDTLSNRYRFPIFDLSDEKLAKITSKFKTTSFDYINGYTSSIVLFAKYLKRNNLLLKDLCPTLKACIVTSEMLFESDRALLENQFQVPVINEYGASELGLIAFQNQDGDLQVNDTLLYLEVVDDQNNPLPDGEIGRIIITSLYNKAHPFIRYEIGDLGALARKNKGDHTITILKNLQGRTNDIARLPSGKVVPGLTFYYVTKTIIEEDGNVQEFVIEQTQIDSFTITYTAQRELTIKEKKAIEQATFKYLEEGLTIHFHKVEVLDRSNRGKLRQFSSTIT